MAAQQPSVELDFLGVHDHREAITAPPSIDRRLCFRGIQNAISKINPELVKSVIASASGDGFLFPAAPISASSTFRSKIETAKEIAPMTIFHNGTVTVFDVTKDQAESILNMAKSVSAKTLEGDKVAASSTDSTMNTDGDALEEGLPHTRRKSLERFFLKRKERLMSVSPYETEKRKNNAVSESGPSSARGHWLGLPATPPL